MKKPAGLESSVGTTERLSQEVCSFLAKVRSMLIRVQDTSIPDSISDTMAGILEALAVKPDGEDPLVAVVRCLLSNDDARGGVRRRQGHKYIPERR
jgi:hypothetical protein